MRLPVASLPANPPAGWPADLTSAVKNYFARIAVQLNGLSEGRFAVQYAAQAQAPTVGAWAQGDFVANSNVAAGPGSFIRGWRCVQSGTPGSWVEEDVPIGVAWSAYTPVVAAGSGALTTVSASGRYLQIGKTVQLALEVLVTANGTGGSFILASLPPGISGSAALPHGQQIIAGREILITGKMLQALIVGPNAEILNYDNSYPAANGYCLAVTGSFEAA
jgi:hypothetical protein